MPRRHPTLPAALLIAAVSSALPARADLVNLVPGSTVKGASGGAVRGTVVAEAPAEVTVRVGNADQKVPAAEIASIRYDGRPPSLDQAVAREEAGALAEAADLYKKAAADASTKPFIARDALFGQARVSADLALNDPSRTDAAIALLEGFLKAHGDGRQVLPALEALAQLQLQKGADAPLRQTLDRIAKIPGAGDRAGVLRARLATRRGDHASAVAELDALVARAPEGSIRRRDALLAKAESLVAQKKVPEAEALLRGVIAAAPPEDAATQAAAYNTLGDALRAAGRTRDALYAYLHTDLLYAQARDQHPRALARIVQLWRDLKRDDRADEVFERLKSEYPRSPYVAEVARPGAGG